MCDCWTDDIWKAIHTIAKISSIKEQEEKKSFCALIMSINKLISCSVVDKALRNFMDHPDTKISLYLNSNEELFKWTIFLRQAINKDLYLDLKSEPEAKNNYIDYPTLQDIQKQYVPNLLTKNVWGSYLWKLVHMISLRTKLEEDGFCSQDVQKALKAFMTCVGILIPCLKCRKHAWEYYQTHSINEYLDTNLHAFEFSVLFHNEVTIRTNQEYGNIHPTYSPLQALMLYIKQLPPHINFSEKFLNKTI